MYESDGQPIPAHRFAHQAMATLFEIICVHEDKNYTEQAARAAFDLIDRLESELTCHRSSSDISRINRLKRGEDTPVGMWAMECLLLARHFHAETGGAFDISLGSGLETIEMIPAESRVRVHGEGVTLDLGGIGKGYAIDRAAELLKEWGIDRAIVHGGYSSVLVLDAPQDREGWPLTISLPGSAPVLARIRARHQAWSASGIRYLGKVGSGFDERKLDSIGKELLKTPRASKPVKAQIAEEAQTVWLEPQHVCEVRYSSTTKEGVLRDAVFVRMRPDLTPEDLREPEPRG
jgi:thiamine biosynthesis lipoprotein